MDSLAWLHLTLAYSSTDESLAPSEKLSHSQEKTPHRRQHLVALSFLLGLLLASNPAFALRQGDRGEEVAALQRQLQASGYFAANVTSYYGPITAEAVRSFQRAQGLAVDGIAGPQTMAVLGQPVSAAPAGGSSGDTSSGSSSGGTVLRRTSQGAAVTTLQNQLQAAGYYSGPVTGYFGSLTQASLQRFQASRGLAADGIYGSRTRAALQNVLNGRQSQSLGGGSTTGQSAGSATRQSSQQLRIASTNRLYYGRTLRKGNSGAAVTNLQNRLSSAGYYSGPITGYYGELTRLAVRKFQAAKGLAPDGVAGPNTLAVLLNQTASASQPSNRVQALAPSSITRFSTTASGFSVLDLQRRLKSRGFDPGPLDGRMGPLTNAAIAKAQQAYGLSRDRVLAGTF